MDEMIKNEWIADLTSGKFNQLNGDLCSLEDNAYCCLGVLYKTLERLGRAELLLKGKNSYAIKADGLDRYEEIYGYLEKEHKVNTAQFIRMNDNFGLGFIEIAEKIKEQPELTNYVIP